MISGAPAAYARPDLGPVVRGPVVRGPVVRGSAVRDSVVRVQEGRGPATSG